MKAGKSLRRTQIRSLRPGDPVPAGTPRRYVNSQGYIRLRWKVGPAEYVETYEHRLVAGLPDGSLHVHHRNGDKRDNERSNLEVLTPEEHQRKHGVIRAQAHPRRRPEETVRGRQNIARAARKLERRVRFDSENAEMRRLYEDGLTLTEIAKRVGIHHTNVLRRLRQTGAAIRPPRKRTNAFDSDEAVQMYTSGMGIQAVAAWYGVSAQRILREVDKRGLARKRAGRPSGVKPTGEAEARRLVYARSGRVCEKCGSRAARDWHHRKNRSQGGTWSAENGLHLCRKCHHWVTTHPSEGYANGWLIKGSTNPLTEPVFVAALDRKVWLTTNGRYSDESPVEVAS